MTPILMGSSRHGSLSVCLLCLLQVALIQIQDEVELPTFSIKRDYEYGISPKLVQQLHGMLLEYLVCASDNMCLSSLSGGYVVSNPPGANQVPMVLEGIETTNSRPSHIPSPFSGETPNSRPNHIPSHCFYLVTNDCSVCVIALCLQDVKTIPKWTVPSRLRTYLGTILLPAYLGTTLLPPNCVPFDPDEASTPRSTASEGESGQDNVRASLVPSRACTPRPVWHSSDPSRACTLRPVWHSSQIPIPSQIHLDVVILHNVLHVGKYICPFLLLDSDEVTHLPPDCVVTHLPPDCIFI